MASSDWFLIKVKAADPRLAACLASTRSRSRRRSTWTAMIALANRTTKARCDHGRKDQWRYSREHHPREMTMAGTIRTLDPRCRRCARKDPPYRTKIAESMGATAEFRSTRNAGDVQHAGAG